MKSIHRILCRISFSWWVVLIKDKFSMSGFRGKTSIQSHTPKWKAVLLINACCHDIEFITISHRVFHWGFSSFYIYVPTGSYSSFIFSPNEWLTIPALGILLYEYFEEASPLEFTCLSKLVEVFCLNSILGVTHAVNNCIHTDTYHIKKPQNQQPPPHQISESFFPISFQDINMSKRLDHAQTAIFLFFFFLPLDSAANKS